MRLIHVFLVSPHAKLFQWCQTLPDSYFSFPNEIKLKLQVFLSQSVCESEMVLSILILANFNWCFWETNPHSSNGNKQGHFVRKSVPSLVI